MKRFITIASALALVGSFSYAMEEVSEEATMEEAMMDEEMMMEAPAPSVTIAGSAEIGFKNVDDSLKLKPDAESIQLIREYKVAFSSSGTTDGGILFGAGININDTEDNDPHQSVSAANVHVGAADGSWKLQLGGNDPGIEVAGGIGVADDHFGGGKDATIGLSGAFEGATFRITMSNPSNTVTARKISWDGTYKDSGLDSDMFGYSYDSAGAETVPTDVTGFDAARIDGILKAAGVKGNTKTFISAAKFKEWAAACGISYTDGNVGTDATDDTDDNAGDGIVQPHGTGENQDTYAVVAANLNRCSDEHLDMSDTVSVTDNHADHYASKAKTDNWSVGFSYELNPVTVGVGMDSHKGLALQLGTDLAGVAVKAFYGKSEFDKVRLGTEAKVNRIIRNKAPGDTATAAGTAFTTAANFGRGTDQPPFGDGYTVDLTVKDIMGRQENTGIGVSASVPAGEGATFTVAYSTNKMEQMSTGTGASKIFNGTATTKLIDIDFEYALGGGATFKAGIDKKDVETIKRGTTAGVVTPSDVTTLSASIGMTF